MVRTLSYKYLKLVDGFLCHKLPAECTETQKGPMSFIMKMMCVVVVQQLRPLEDLEFK
jgi:hypothetical protein